MIEKIKSIFQSYSTNKTPSISQQVVKWFLSSQQEQGDDYERLPGKNDARNWLKVPPHSHGLLPIFEYEETSSGNKYTPVDLGQILQGSNQNGTLANTRLVNKVKRFCNVACILIVAVGAVAPISLGDVLVHRLPFETYAMHRSYVGDSIREGLDLHVIREVAKPCMPPLESRDRFREATETNKVYSDWWARRCRNYRAYNYKGRRDYLFR